MKKALCAVLIAGGGWLAGAAAAPNSDPYPNPGSKKGLQVQMVPDAIQLGIKHATLNCTLPGLVEASAQPDSLRGPVDGVFFRAKAVAALDSQIRPLSEAGIVVTLILLNQEGPTPAVNERFLHPKYAKGEKHNKISAFNTTTPAAETQLRAVIEFLAARYSAPGGPRVWGYIVGNEVNSHWFWHNQGRATLPGVAREYEAAVRVVHESVRKHSQNARVYLSLDHFWADRYKAGAPDQTGPGRELLELFAARAKERGDFDWHIAYHPYPENLTDPRFWRDKTAKPTEDTPRITFKNLEVLTRYLAKPEHRFAGQPRRVILSEQGFNCPDRPDGERDQAAGFCAAWWGIANLEGIDVFILHRHVDHAHEGGLNLGLWTRKPDSVATPDRPRQMYGLFRVADTPEWEAAFRFALPVIGIERWDALRGPQ